MAMAEVDPQLVQTVVNRISVQPTRRLAEFLPLFCRERFLWDYAEDGKLMVRLNQVLRRVGLAPLAESVREILPKPEGKSPSTGELLEFEIVEHPRNNATSREGEAPAEPEVHGSAGASPSRK